MATDLSGPAGNVSSRVQSVARAVDLLRAVAGAAGSDASVASLAKQAGLNRATAWRILTTLEAQGMVTRDGHNGWYAIGPTFDELAALGGGQERLLDRAQPVLERLSLETGEVACLGLVDGDTVSYAAEAMPAMLEEQSWLGEPAALHASSVGKAFLASLDLARLDEVLSALPLTRFTASTITDLDVLREDLVGTRRRGYAVCRGELEDGAWGVAAPVLGAHRRPVAVLCLWGPDHRGGPDRFEALGRLTRGAARTLSRTP